MLLQLLLLLLLLLLANDVTQLLNACADVLKTRRSSSETFYTSLFHQNC